MQVRHGLAGVRTVSMASALQRPVDLAAVRQAFVEAFGAVFGVRMDPAPIEAVAVGGADARPGDGSAAGP